MCENWQIIHKKIQQTFIYFLDCIDYMKGFHLFYPVLSIVEKDMFLSFTISPQVVALGNNIDYAEWSAEACM